MDLKRLVRTVADEPVVMFTHAMFIRAFVWVLPHGPQDVTGDEMRKFREFSRGFSLPNCSILSVDMSAGAVCQHVKPDHLSAQFLGG
jgi:broad specificity phosphatase PhoE